MRYSDSLIGWFELVAVFPNDGTNPQVEGAPEDDVDGEDDVDAGAHEEAAHEEEDDDAKSRGAAVCFVFGK